MKQERGKYSYAGMFYRYEGVYAALKHLQQQNKSESIKFCNLVFVDHFEKQRDDRVDWELYVSVDPDQCMEAWKIICDEMENTSLAIQGAIFSSDKSQPGTHIALRILTSDYPKQPEILQFLALLAERLAEEGIRVDSRPRSQEALLAVIPSEGLPEYYVYGNEGFTVIEDQLWDDFAGRKDIAVIAEGMIAMEGEHKILIKASHYQTLGNARVNPLALTNPFENLKITSFV